MEIDVLGDFNEVIEYYKCMIDIADKIRPNIIFEYSMTAQKIATHNYWMAKLRAIINSIGVSIAQNYEAIDKDNGKYRVREEDIEEAFKGKDYFYTLMKENNMPPYEVIKQIRNCLVHGEYKIEFEDISSVELIEDDMPAIKGPFNAYVVLDNGRIKGKINITEINGLEYIFSDLYTFYSDKAEMYIVAGNSKFASCKNKYFLEKYLKSIKKFIIRGKKDENESKDNIENIISKMIKQGIVTTREQELSLRKRLQTIKKHSGANQFEAFEENPKVLEENKRFLEEYIKFLGLSNYEFLVNKANPYVYKLFNEDVIQATFGDNVGVDLTRCFCDVIDIMLNDESKKNNVGLDIRRASYEGPVIYANMLLALGNYVCVFLKETNNNERSKDISIFEYHNLDNIESIIPIIDDDKQPSIVKGINGSEKYEKIENTIKDYESTLSSYEKSIREREKKISKLNDKNPKKDELKEKYEREIAEYSEKIENLKESIKRLRARENEYTEKYNDYTNLFRHLRNSIAHGTYKIDYIEALKRKDMRKIKYTFEDYPIGDVERKNPEFRLEITAANFLKLIESVQRRVNKEVELEDSTILENSELKRKLIKKRTSQEIGEASYTASAEECDAAQSFLQTRLKERKKGETEYSE